MFKMVVSRAYVGGGHDSFFVHFVADVALGGS